MSIKLVPVPRTVHYSTAKSGAADSDCGVKVGAENSLIGFNHCVSSSKRTVGAALGYEYRYQ